MQRTLDMNPGTKTLTKFSCDSTRNHCETCQRLKMKQQNKLTQKKSQIINPTVCK